ncbi:MAG: AAA family ATPase, partial [Deltaproteobacteria bacterium]|nr:AAA family ATPase [Deltaproteobacteria bacterium]
MIRIPDYTIGEQISASESSRVYRGYANLDKKPVIIKVPAAESPSRPDLAKIRWEYEIANSLEIEGIVKPVALISSPNCALILEDFGGFSLSSLVDVQKIELLLGLRIAIRLAKTIGRIHQKGIIHKDVKLANIIINPETEQVKLSDFSIASRISGEKQPHVKPDLLEGTLTYMAPEQTGRMNRSIDHRADLYSFGISLYKMFTGVLPFEDTGMVELIHCHMAIPPQPPCKKDPNIPEQLSDIILKLLAKNAEDRYQSAFGLGHDLEECFTQLKTEKKVKRFVLGQNDIPTTMQIPEKLYGRETELAELVDAFRQTAQGKTEFLLVKGAPGIGKSVLINELHKPVIEQKGFFTSGKFDQFKHDLPYIAIRQAFTDLTRQLLCESTESISAWGEKIKKNIGPNGQILIDLIPELKHIVGTQPPVESLPPTQSQNRFNIVFNEFVNVFARKEHPLVLFLDDMQWADWATLKLVEHLV